MTATDNYKAAKDAFNDHVARHKCKPMMLAPEGQVCETRRLLWRAMMQAARGM